jgi:hypothetical protein
MIATTIISSIRVKPPEDLNHERRRVRVRKVMSVPPGERWDRSFVTSYAARLYLYGRLTVVVSPLVDTVKVPAAVEV